MAFSDSHVSCSGPALNFVAGIASMRKLLRPDAGRTRMAVAADGRAQAPQARPPAGQPELLARYIAQMAGELSGLARTAQLELLVYFLDMAQAEAELNCRLPLESSDTEKL